MKPTTDFVSKLYKKDVNYSITINPSNRINYDGFTFRENTRLIEVYESIKETFFNHSFTYCKYTLWPEMSVPPVYTNGKYSRIHFHGVINFSNPAAWLENVSPLLSDYMVEIDTIDNLETWLNYCQKDSDTMEPYTVHKKLKYPLKSCAVGTSSK